MRAFHYFNLKKSETCILTHVDDSKSQNILKQTCKEFLQSKTELAEVGYYCYGPSITAYLL